MLALHTGGGIVRLEGRREREESSPHGCITHRLHRSVHTHTGYFIGYRMPSPGRVRRWVNITSHSSQELVVYFTISLSSSPGVNIAMQ